MASDRDDGARINVIPSAPLTACLPDGAIPGHLRQTFGHLPAAHAQALQHLVHKQERQEDHDFVAVSSRAMRRDLVSLIFTESVNCMFDIIVV